MRKRNGVLLTLALVGTITLCGTGGLYVSMAKTMQKDTTTQVEHKAEEFMEENTQEAAENQIWQEEESFYLPEGAQVKELDKICREINWGNYTIRYYHGGWNNPKETQEDLGMAKLMPIIKSTIKQYSGQELRKCEMCVSLIGPVEGDEEKLIAEWADENGAHVEFVECIPRKDFSMPEFNIDKKYYEVSIFAEKQEYDIWVDSMTGEVLAYYYNDNTLGNYPNGWEIIKEADDVLEYKLTEAEQKEYDSIIESFVTDELKLGNLEKIYGQNWGVTPIANGSKNDVRAYYAALCKTDDGAMLEVTIDIGEKKVTSFNTMVTSYLTENQFDKLVKE